MTDLNWLAVTPEIVLLGMAVPSFSSSVARARLEGVVNELSIDLQYARSLSIRRRAAVTLTTAADGRSYDLTLGNETLKSVALPSGVALTSTQVAASSRARTTAMSRAW